MSRSQWKGLFVNPNYIRLKESRNKTKLIIHPMSKNSYILPKFVGLQFAVYNGNKNINVLVSEAMVGHKFGEFVNTRAKFVFKKKAKR